MRVDRCALKTYFLIFVDFCVDQLHQVGSDSLQGHEHHPHDVGLAEQDCYYAWKEEKSQVIVSNVTETQTKPLNLIDHGKGQRNSTNMYVAFRSSI